jgi:spermidine synthase
VPNNQASLESPFLVEQVNPNYGFFLRVEPPLLKGRTEYQDIEVFDTPMFGRVLRLDNVFQTSDRDEFFYHENMCHVPAIAHPEPKRALVIGGGDGGAAEELLKHRTMERVVVAELDPGVVAAAKKYLGKIHNGVFDDPRLEVRIMDGKAYIETTDDRFDQIVVDLTDASGPSLALYTREFYGACRRVLGEQGVLSLHVESPIAHPNTFNRIVKTLQAVFKIVRPYLVYVPTYGSLWGMACASDLVDPLELSAEQVDARIGTRGLRQLQYYNGDTHRAVFAQPNFVRNLLAQDAEPLTVSNLVAGEVIPTEERGNLVLQQKAA